jgi:hypothetical protein
VCDVIKAYEEVVLPMFDRLKTSEDPQLKAWEVCGPLVLSGTFLDLE